ncbi:DUF5682 family protein [Gloeobacter kilaueensis]|uniref:4-aminobutyrate aminotransferase n=1 Tax=Gloeobacter kilaueensis (strain ATCC BAA-2537 / CCAP 1431/1 / ULC 316 / JS1) TaxID=1183438 RepID=U5QFN7_GLOK1|nr:DUF5682 family protein [Gloeobacter kilaueensis]AGY57693.1 hypothetical protein GKIL_1447 [Gloeobacter kilaueensis JS1]
MVIPPVPSAPDLEPALYQSDGPVVFFPVRHHSPAAARLLAAFIRRIRPEAVLVEGPADFNDRIEELFLPHQLPVAIYSYFQKGERRRGAFYPFCIYSPEWQALVTGREVGAVVRFIDLPWADLSAAEEETLPAHRYADGPLRTSDCVAVLCERFAVGDFDELWDLLFEVDPDLSLEDYLQRCHRLCYLLRTSGGEVSAADLRREAFMAAQIRQIAAAASGPVLVVTGGFHSHALFSHLRSDSPPPVPCCPAVDERGIALTPYSYERLDRLTGYEAGMPGPGFYQHAWDHAMVARQILAAVAQDLRERKQVASSADLIAAWTMASALADLRGHRRVWRRDLIDGVTAALVKEELTAGLAHPFLAAVHAVLRGKQRGRLAPGTRLPPLVADLRRQLAHFNLEPQQRERTVELDLHEQASRDRSRVLHQLHTLEVAGFGLVGGSDLLGRDELERIWERWRLLWSPELEANAIEAAVYGPTLAEAAQSRLIEQVEQQERDAKAAARLVLAACQMGFSDLGAELLARLEKLLRGDHDFFALTAAAGSLLYLYRYDDALGSAGGEALGRLLAQVFDRSLGSMAKLGRVQGRDRELVQAVRTLLEICERCGAALGLDRAAVCATFAEVAADATALPLLRGATSGALWTLAAPGGADLSAFSAAGVIGDYLTGLFALGREVVQRQPELLSEIDELVSGFDEQTFLEALPALRLAFTSFSPREKHTLAQTLFPTAGDGPPPVPLAVDAQTAALALAFEAQVLAQLDRYGLRGGSKDV